MPCRGNRTNAPPACPVTGSGRDAVSVGDRTMTTKHRNIPFRQVWLALGLAPCLALNLAWAQQSDPAAPPPIPPVDEEEVEPEAAPEGDVPIPPKKLTDEQIDETVDIRRDEEGNIVEEYRRDGRVYMVKVTPKVGVPYYYFDDDGDGQLELAERDRAAHPVKPVHWKIKEW